MGKGIEISIAANTRDFQKGTKDVEKGLEQVKDSLDDLSKAAQRDGDKMGDNLSDGVKDGAKDVNRETEKVERSFKELADTAKRESKTAGTALGDDVKRGADRASDGIKEVGDEAASTAKEAAASFDGSAASIGDAFQEVAANAFAGFGPAGLVAGVAAAAGIGVIISKLDEAGEGSEAFRERVSELTTELINVGDSGGAGLDYMVEKLKELAATTEDGVTSLSDLAQAADDNGRSFEDLSTYFVGNAEGLDKVVKAEEEYLEALVKSAAAAQVSGEESSDAANRKAEGQKLIVDSLRESQKATAEAQAAEDAYIRAGGPELEAKAERASTYAESISETLTEAGEDWQEYADKESGALNLETYNANIEARVEAMKAYQANMSTIQGTISDEAYNYLVSLGADAAPLLQAYADAPLDQKQRTAANWATLGTAASTEYQSKLKAGIPATIDGPTIVTKIDNSAYDRVIGGLPKRIGGPAIEMQAKILGGPTG